MTETLPATINEVRSRFTAAEKTLSGLIDSLEEIKSASERFNVSGNSLTAVSQDLSRLAGQLGSAVSSVNEGITIMRSGMTVIEGSDPGKVNSELTRLGEKVDGLTRSIAVEIEERVSSTAEQSIAKIDAALLRHTDQLFIGFTELRQRMDTTLVALSEVIERTSTADGLLNADLKATQSMLQSIDAHVRDERVDRSAILKKTTAESRTVLDEVKLIVERIGREQVEARQQLAEDQERRDRRFLFMVLGVGFVLVVMIAAPRG